MTLVTGYAVYFSAGRSQAAAGDGVSGGSMLLDFDPNFAEHSARGIVDFPELGKRDGDFFALEGVSYFVPENADGLPIEYEGRVVLIVSNAADVDKDRRAPSKASDSKPAIAKFESTHRQETKAKKLRQTAFYDVPDATDYLAKQAQKNAQNTCNDTAPDRDLSASLRTAFEPTIDDAQSEPDPSYPLQIAAQHANLDESGFETPPTRVARRDPGQTQITSRATPMPTPLVNSDDDDWAVYLAPQPTLSAPAPSAPVQQVVQIITPVQAPPADHGSSIQLPDEPTPFDPSIDLVLAGSEKEAFALLAQEVVETVESFETLKKIEKAEEPEPMLTAELRKLDPSAPDIAPKKLLPWGNRQETEEEMLARLTIKSERYAG